MFKKFKKTKRIILSATLITMTGFGINCVLKNNNTKNIENKIHSESSLKINNQNNYEEIVERKKYDGREEGYVPSFVEMQGGTNLCWAYTTAAISEISILKKGIQGDKYNKDNLSFYERQIDYVTNVRNVEADRLGLTKNDIFKRELDKGGSTSRAAKALSKWTGPKIEKPLHYDPSHTDYKEYVNPEFLLTSYEVIKQKSSVLTNDEIKKVKKLVAKYGAVSLGHYITYRTDEQYVFANYEDWNGHAATIIGWDDNISKEKFFSNNEKPKRDGAWIIRNSWGNRVHGEGKGYFYMSYDSLVHDLVAVDYVKNTEYENNYFYDGIILGSDADYNINDFKNKTIGVIFPPKKASYNKKEFLKGVMVGIKGENVKVKVDIYNGVNASLANRFSKNNIPNSGTLVATKEQTFENEGVYTIELSKLIELELDKNFSVVVSVSNPNNDASVAFSKEDQSYNDLTFVLSDDKTGWKNTWSPLGPYVARIGALTITEKKDGDSNNDIKYADVELIGNSYLRYGDDKPIANVKFNGIELKKDVDYNISYELDTNKLETTPSTDNYVIGGIQFIIKGIGKYNGLNKSLTCPLIIGKMPKIPESIGVFKDGKIEITVNKNISYFNQITLPSDWKWAFNDAKIDDEQYLSYVGKDSNYYRDNFFDISVIKQDVPDQPKINIENANVELEQNSFTYSGKENKPIIKTIVLNEINLKQNSDYRIEYENNINAGNGKIKITGINGYNGQKQISFEIKKATNVLNIENNNGEIKVNSTFGTPIIKYYSDPNCKNEISKPATPGKYYVKASVEGNKNWTSATSSVVELIIENNPTPPVDPTPPIKPDNENKQHSNSNAIIIASIVTPISLIVIGGIIAGVIILKKKH